MAKTHMDNMDNIALRSRAIIYEFLLAIDGNY